jgi:hypothetical protein
MREKAILIFLFLIVLLAFFVQAVIAPVDLIFSQNVTSIYDEGNFSLNWTAGDSDSVSNYSIYIYSNGILYLKDRNSSTSSYAFNNSTESNYTFKVSALNSSEVEGVNSSSVSIYVDRTPPTITVPFYGNATKKRNTENLTLNISVIDASSGLTNSFCKISIGGNENTTVAVSNGWCNLTNGNLTNLSYGNKIISIYVNDTVNNFGLSNSFAVDIDASIITTLLNSPEDEEGFSSTSVSFNCSFTSSYGGGNVSLYGNGSGSWVLNETKNLSGFSNSTTFIKSLSANKVYLWNCYSCDVLGNCNLSSSNGTFFVDTTKPIVRLVSPADDAISTSTSQTFKFNVTDNFRTKNCSLYVDDDIEENYSNPSNSSSSISFSSVTLEGTASGLSYEWYVGCYDYAGNFNESATWTIFVKESSSSDNSGSDSSSDDTDYWITTYSPSSSDINAEEGYTKELIAKTRIKMNVSNSNHYLGLVSLTTTTATINVSSISQQKTFNIGDENKFEITGDDYYDLLVKLNNITNSRANISIKVINEKMPENLELNETIFNIEDKNSSSVGEGLNKSLGEKAIPFLVVIALIGICVVIFYIVRRRRLYGY